MPVSGSRLVRVGAAVLVAVALVAVDGAAADAGALRPRTPVNAAAAAAGKPVARVSVAPDLVSARVAARVAARAQGARVEVLAERDEFSTTWVNPEGR